MEKRKSSVLILLSFILLFAFQANAQNTARIQLIHNSADKMAAHVDVFINDQLAIDNFAFRTATPFIDIPAETNLTVKVVPSSNDSPDQMFWTTVVNFDVGKTYVAIANGVFSKGNYKPTVPFGLSIFEEAMEQSATKSTTDLLVFHGSTDAPAVDIKAFTGNRPGGEFPALIEDLSFGHFAGYLSVPANDYQIEIMDQSGTASVATYSAPLNTLDLSGTSLVVVASGYLNPSENQNGAPFGLWVALPTGGDMIALPLANTENRNTARVQVIHNSADAAASVVDVWLDNTLLIDNFAFRTATPFVDAPAGTPFTIAIKDQNSTSPENPIWSKNYNLAENGTYILVADGIVSPEGYSPATPFDIAVYAMGRESANMTGKTDVLVHHGSTDAPTVDVFETGVGAGQIIDNFVYGAFAGYLELGTLDYVLEVRDETGTVTVASYQAPLATLGLNGAALTVIASGFLNPAANSSGPAFGLYAALATGGDLVMLPGYTPPGVARVQVIHNSADLAATTVDVWANDDLLLDNFAFRTATPFVDVAAGVPVTLAVQPANSTSPANPLYSVTVSLEDGKKYIVVANGLVSTNGYEPSQPFNLYIYDMARETASNPANTDVLVFHGSTDAPTVDIYESGVGAGLIIDNLDYTEFNGYLELPADDYTLQIRDESGTTVVATFGAPLESLGLTGKSLAVMASGFLNPANNSNGPAFGLYAALPEGGNLVPLTNTSSIYENRIIAGNISIGPNPAREKINISFEMQQSALVKIDLIDLTGNVIKSENLGFRSDFLNTGMDLSGIAEGMYMMRIMSGDQQVTRKVIIN